MSSSSYASLTRRLVAEGLVTKPISLKGRFHIPLLERYSAKILELCEATQDLRLPTAERLLVPLRSNTDGELVINGLLHEFALRSIMSEVANWHLTMSYAVSQFVRSGSLSAVSIGLVDVIPSSIVRESGLLVVKLGDLTQLTSSSVDLDSKDSGTLKPPNSTSQNGCYPESAVAVIGMASKFPGADTLEEFWDIISSGTSMLQEVPPERFPTREHHRNSGKSRFWGNFVRDVDAFDHSFFKRSAREAASMDPQQRLLLQVAYHALESSGHFGRSYEISEDVGCYLGVCATDYNDNVSSHNPTAFSSIGTLRAFLSGRISHFFGWTGPSITYDTACSSSAVAIDAACKAINLGECSSALAGGATIFTSPYFFENLSAASFLSPTGASKPFDAKADGYCRGEGIGLVVLKKLSAAENDGDNILGVITATSVNQNSNAVSITVPHSPSQVKLYRKVLAQAGVRPTDISYVEAHGTGTLVGDPLEFESIRAVFGRPQRQDILNVASVKGNIGHTEGTSGVAALIKAVLMIQHGVIPMQASFTTLNPKISPLETDQMAIPRTSQKWEAKPKMALINNYGASGSNAAMILCQPPLVNSFVAYQSGSLSRYPIFLSANSSASLKAYCVALQSFLKRLSPSLNILPSLAFNLAIKQNRMLPLVQTTTVGSLAELHSHLTTTASDSSSFQKGVIKTKPMVLVFSGQSRSSVALSREAYDSSDILRFHLDHCNEIIRSLGYQELYPGIFQEEPVESITALHSMLFSLQYSCARAWIDSGLQVNAVIGHSFGQLTALSISGSISLEHGLQLIIGRASLMQTRWGSEKGSMISLEADIDSVQKIISSVGIQGLKLEIACYNGPTSHVLVGSDAAIQAVEQSVTGSTHPYSLPFKKLEVTHGFHSEFTDPLLPDLLRLAESCKFKKPSIWLETCSDGQSWSIPDPKLIVEHTRTSVYFGQAVERLVQRFGPCTWLQIGSPSSTLGMIRRALAKATVPDHTFCPIELEKFGAMSSLAETTVKLWDCGYKVQFWPFHQTQRFQYSQLNLPPYQFEKPRHWLTWIDGSRKPLAERTEKLSKPTLLLLVKSRDDSDQDAKFHVDRRSEQFRLLMQGHAVVGTPLCPAPLYIELAAQAAMALDSNAKSFNFLPCVDSLDIESPLGHDENLQISLKLTRIRKSPPTWEFAFSSQSLNNSLGRPGHDQQHATGTISLLRPDNVELNASFDRFRRLIEHRQLGDFFTDPRAQTIGGSLIYRLFARVVNYADCYQGVKYISAKKHEAVGRVTVPNHDGDILGNMICNPLAVDSFMQVAGLHLNVLRDCADGYAYVCTKVDRIQPGPEWNPAQTNCYSWSVYSSHSSIGDKEIVNDIYVLDPESKILVMIILGVHFHKVLISSLAKVLSRLDSSPLLPTSSAENSSLQDSNFRGDRLRKAHNSVSHLEIPMDPISELGVEHCVKSKLTSVGLDPQELFSRIMNTPLDEVTSASTLEELEIDSPMMGEILAELHQTSGVLIHMEELQGIPNFQSLSDFLQSKQQGYAESNFQSSLSSPGHAGLLNLSPESIDAGKSSPSDLSVSKEEIISRLAQMLGSYLGTTVTMDPETALIDIGFDSLLAMELAHDIENIFDVKLDVSHLNNASSFGDLSSMVLEALSDAHLETSAVTEAQPSPRPPVANSSPPVGDDLKEHAYHLEPLTQSSISFGNVQKAFEYIRHDYDMFAKLAGGNVFWKDVYPMQARLVSAYIIEACASLGCSLAMLKPGERVPKISVHSSHQPLTGRLYSILKDASYVVSDGVELIRSQKVIDPTPASQVYHEILEAFPEYAGDHMLLHITGSQLAQCLNGTVDALSLLFESQNARALMEAVFTNDPMCATTTELLCSFLGETFSTRTGEGDIHILEIGGGTCGTTKRVVEFLSLKKVPFTYTFTDISSPFVATAKQRFAGLKFMNFDVLDIEKTPPIQHSNRYHIIIAANCVHATRNVTRSLANTRQMLRNDGFICLVEFTKEIFWFDLVYGLLKGWWLFEDGRDYALADEAFWAHSMRAAGFKHVSWTEGASLESRSIRIITGFKAESDVTGPQSMSLGRKLDFHTETVVYQQTGETLLSADIYYPTASEVSPMERPVGKFP